MRVEDIEVQKKGAHLGFTERCESVGVARGICREDIYRLALGRTGGELKGEGTVLVRWGRDRSVAEAGQRGDVGAEKR